jgi:transcriptional regulator with XRE-family HTH domain
MEPAPPRTSLREAPSACERVAANLRRLRKAKGLSQEQMAEAAEFHRTYVSQLERCVTNISVTGLERLANALGVDILELLQPPPPNAA